MTALRVWFCVCWCCKAWHGCVLWAGLFKGKTWLSPVFTVGMWQTKCAAAYLLPAHEGAHASKCQLVAGPVWESVCWCVCPASSGQKVCLGKCWQHWSLFIPSPWASIIQFPRMLQPVATPVHTHRHTQPMHTCTQSITLTLNTGAVCKHRVLLTLKYSFAHYPPWVKLFASW